MAGRHRLENVTMGQPYRPRVTGRTGYPAHARDRGFFAGPSFFAVGAVKSHRRTPRMRFW